MPSFEQLLSTTGFQFYQQDLGTDYAQARYLCYYLQENGLLIRYYREFHANRASDPTGIQSLRKVLGTHDIDAFKKQWETYVLGLQFP